MFNSYNDAQLMNESYVFYATSTNTFRNPAFAVSDDDDEQRNYGSPKQDQLVREQIQHQRQQHGPAEQPGPSSTRHGNASTTTKQRLIDFCDNFAFTMRGRMFIMETNLKRRLRALRRFLDKRVLARRRWWLSTSTRSGGGCGDGIGHCSADHGQLATSSSLRDLIDNERCSLGARQFSAGGPISAKCLGFQQERILTRLERIKRDSQRLFDMQHATIIESDNETAGDEVASNRPSRDSADAAQSNRCQVPVWLARSGTSQPTESADSPALAEASNRPSHQPRTTQSGRWAAISRGNKQIRQVAAAYSLSNPKKTCIVCYERTPNIVTLPCEHSDICSDCFIEIIYMAVKNSQYPLRCVLCRQKVERIRCSRRLMLSVIKKNRKSSSKTGGSGWTKSSKISCRLPF